MKEHWNRTLNRILSLLLSALLVATSVNPLAIPAYAAEEPVGSLTVSYGFKSLRAFIGFIFFCKI